MKIIAEEMSILRQQGLNIIPYMDDFLFVCTFDSGSKGRTYDSGYLLDSTTEKLSVRRKDTKVCEPHGMVKTLYFSIRKAMSLRKTHAKGHPRRPLPRFNVTVVDWPKGRQRQVHLHIHLCGGYGGYPVHVKIKLTPLPRGGRGAHLEGTSSSRRSPPPLQLEKC